MELARELAECPLDVGIRGATVDAENLVVVALGRRHQSVEGTGTGGRYCGPLVVLVDVFDEPGELECRSANGPDRLVVVHPQRAEESDGSERAARDPVGGADVRDVVQLASVDLGADADDGAARIEGVGEELENSSASLEHVEQVLTRFELGATRVAEQPRGAADEELRPVVCDRVDERRPQAAEECPFARGQHRVLEPPAERGRAETQADGLLLEIRARPVDESRVDRLLELEDPLRDPSGGRDHDDDHRARLQLEHVHMPYRGGLEGRCGDEREEPCRLGEGVGGCSQGCSSSCLTLATSSAGAATRSARPSMAPTSSSAYTR